MDKLVHAHQPADDGAVLDMDVAGKGGAVCQDDLIAVGSHG